MEWNTLSTYYVYANSVNIFNTTDKYLIFKKAGDTYIVRRPLGLLGHLPFVASCTGW